MTLRGQSERRLTDEESSRECGCTCEWFGGGSIIIFDRACPILRLHWVPADREINWKDSSEAAPAPTSETGTSDESGAASSKVSHGEDVR